MAREHQRDHGAPAAAKADADSELQVPTDAPVGQLTESSVTPSDTSAAEVDVPSFIMGSLSVTHSDAAELYGDATPNILETVDHVPDATTSQVDGSQNGEALQQDSPASRGTSAAASDQDVTADSQEAARAPRKQRLRLKEIGRFRVLRILGEGAFGTVYLAHDPQLDRQIALKIAKSGLMAREIDRARFLREARAAAQLRHPHIIPVYEFGQIENTCYIAYQYIEGRTLKSYRRAHGKLTALRAAKLISQLARALHYAHSQGIIHRDIKPDNVIIDDHDQPHITDFGCARRESSSDARRTVHGTVMGTPAYMSPEQATGNSNQADARSDVWSLGIMLMESLTGSLPFKGTTTEVLAHVQQAEAPSLRRLDRSLPKDLETICQKCLAKNPAERFSTAEALADELDRWQRGEPIRSRPISPAARLWRWSHRNPAIASLLVTIFVLLLLGTTLSTALALTAIRQARTRALAQVAALRTASPESIPFLLESLQPFRDDVVASLKEDATKSLPESHRSRIRLALYALHDSPAERAALLDPLLDDLLIAAPEELLVICGVVMPDASRLSGPFWAVAKDGQRSTHERFRAACALAQFDPKNREWSQLAPDVAGQLVVENRVSLGSWLAALRPVRSELLEHLRSYAAGDSQESIVAAAAIADLFQDDAGLLAEMLLDAHTPQLPELLDHVARHDTAVEQLKALVQQPDPAPSGSAQRLERASQIANAEIALLHAGHPIWILNRWSKLQEPTARTLEIHRLGHSGADPQMVKQLINNAVAFVQPLPSRNADVPATLLALGQFDPGRFNVSERQSLAEAVAQIAASHDDPAASSAAHWLRQKWNMTSTVGEQPWSDKPSGWWYRNRSANVLVIFEKVPSFAMGSDQPASGGFDSLPIHERSIPRRFAISTREVTVGEFQRFEEHRLQTLFERRDQASATSDLEGSKNAQQLIDDLQRRRLNRRASQELDHPISDITWFEATAYCRWLGEQEGFDDSQQCYPPVDKIEELFAQFQPFEVPPAALERTGYRLPTAAEWEYACRAGTTTAYPFGLLSAEYHGSYAWTLENSNHRVNHVGQLMPNDAGLFDMLGNVCEWCHDWKLDLPEDMVEPVVDGSDERRGAAREIRGGSFRDLIADLHSAARTSVRPEQGDPTVGFRIARTGEAVE